MEGNYNPSIPEWADANYLRTFMYNDAQVNVLKETLPFQKDHICKRIKRKEGIQNIKIMIMNIQ